MHPNTKQYHCKNHVLENMALVKTITKNNNTTTCEVERTHLATMHELTAENQQLQVFVFF